MQKTKVELKSDWQDTQVEILKALQGYEVADVNKEDGSIDYISETKDDETKLLRVIVDPDLHSSKAYFKTTKKTLEAVENGVYDEATIIAKNFTKASKRLTREEEGLERVSPKNVHHSLIELMDANQKLTEDLCEAKCGKFPVKEEDCQGYQNGEYTCSIRRISDDVDFHAEMGWLELLENDFSRLLAQMRSMDN